jgi:hypothetical protein
VGPLGVSYGAVGNDWWTMLPLRPWAIERSEHESLIDIGKPEMDSLVSPGQGQPCSTAVSNLHSLLNLLMGIRCLKDARALQGIIAHANHAVYPEARTLFCEVIVCMSRRRALGATIRINLESASAKTLICVSIYGRTHQTLDN